MENGDGRAFLMIFLVTP